MQPYLSFSLSFATVISFYVPLRQQFSSRLPEYLKVKKETDWPVVFPFYFKCPGDVFLRACLSVLLIA
jgi:hypothetical protein